MFDSFDFQNPGALWGIALGLAPLLIFLFLKRSPKVISWGAMRFLRHAEERVRRRSRFLEILRLFCQTLGILTLILAVSSPFWKLDSEIDYPTRASANGSSAYLIIVDASASVQETTRAEKAQRLVSVWRSAWLSRVENADIHVVSTSENAVVNWSETLEKIRKLTYGETPRKWREIVMISDFTDSPETLQKFLTEIRALAPGAECRAISVFETVPNVALTALEPIHTPVLSGRKNMVKATLYNDSERVAVGVRVDFRLRRQMEGEGVSAHYETVKTGRKWIEIPIQGEKNITWETEILEPGKYVFEAELSVSEAEQDAFLPDNAIRYDFEAQDVARFLIVETWDENSEAKNTEIARKTTGTTFLRAALEGIFTGRYPDSIEVPLKIETLADVDIATYDLNGFHVVFFCEPTVFTEKEAEVLENYVENGGAVWFFLGKSATQEGLAPLSAILPAKLLKKMEKETVKNIHPVLLQERHAVTEIFRENPDSGLETASISEFLSLGAFPESTTVLRLSNERPLLVLREFRRGRTAMSAISANTAGSALPLLPVWLPLVDRTVHFLITASPIGRHPEAERLNISCSATEIPAGWRFRRVQLSNLEWSKTITNQPLISVLFLVAAMMFAIAGFCLPKKTR